MIQFTEYHIIQKLGKQQNRAFGNVYLVNKVSDESPLILKHNTKSPTNTIQIDQLRSEKQFSFSMEGLPTVIDFQETEIDLFLVKKYQKGIPIDDFWSRLKRKERLPFLKVFVCQFTELLSILHVQNIFHCDLKPSNILINGSVTNFEIELIDFGLAIQQPLSSTRKLKFPLGYAAPELILNQLQLVNSTTDYFSLGIILWRLYNEKLPLMHPNPSIYTNLQLTYPLEDIGLPKGLFQIIEKLTQKPRFKTAPNRMELMDVQTELMKAQSLRYQDEQQLVEDVLALKETKFLGLF